MEHEKEESVTPVAVEEPVTVRALGGAYTRPPKLKTSIDYSDLACWQSEPFCGLVTTALATLTEWFCEGTTSQTVRDFQEFSTKKLSPLSVGLIQQRVIEDFFLQGLSQCGNTAWADLDIRIFIRPSKRRNVYKGRWESVKLRVSVA